MYRCVRLEGFTVILNIINFATISGKRFLEHSPRNPQGSLINTHMT